MNWVVAKEYRDFIHEIAAIPDDFPAHARIIKENMVRQSSVISLAGDVAIFVKRYKMQGWGEMLKYLFLPAKVEREWKNIRLFHQNHLPTVTPVAKGVKRQGALLRDSVLITRHIPDCSTLKEFSLAAHHQSSRAILAQKKEIITKAARQIRMIHERGFFYRDLHAGNILIREDLSGSFDLFFVDLHKAWHLKRVPYLGRIRDLAQLKNSLPSTRSHQIRFLKAYLRAGDPPLLMMAGEIEKYAESLERDHLKSRTRRCLITSSEFMVEKDLKKGMYWKKRDGKDFVDAVFKEYHEAKAQGRIHTLKEQTKSSVSLVTVPRKDETLTVCLKEFKYPSFFYAVRSSFTKSRALKSWVASHGLRVRSFLTPEPLALQEERKGGILQRSILVFEYLDGIEELNAYILKIFDTPVSPGQRLKKKRFIESLSKEIKRLHSRGICQPDLKSNNILVRESKEGWQFFFIDLDRITFKKRLSPREMVKNLAQINASVADCITITDRLRFFRSYAANTPLASHKKDAYREILEIGRKKVTEPYRLNFKKNA